MPESNLRAFVFDSSRRILVPSQDQTVFHITDYHDGYFWGRTVVHLEPSTTSTPTCLSLVGSVTPEGQVFLAFTPVDPTIRATVTQGFGQMCHRRDGWRMEPQMSSGPNALVQVIHWAYMTECRPDEPICQSLPGVGVSIDSLLEQCPGAPHLLGR